LGNKKLVNVGGGLLLAVIGTYLLNSGIGPFFFGLIVLVLGIGLIVRLLLGATDVGDTGSGSARGAAAGAGLSGLLDLSTLKSIPSMNRWVAGGLAAALSLVGLFLYSRASDGMFGLFGALLFFFGLAVVIVFVHQATDYSHEHHPKRDDESPSDQGPAAA
jgi:hypothetical protein